MAKRAGTVKIVARDLRSACALGIISCFVLFLAASAPHRVHHLFENLRPASGITGEKSRGADRDKLQALAASPERGADQGPFDRTSANEDHHNHDPRHHHDHNRLSSRDNHTHDHDTQHSHSHPRGAAASHSHHGEPVSGEPLHASTPHDDPEHDPTAQTVCLLQAAAQHSHLSTAEPGGVIFLKVGFEERWVRWPFLFSPLNPSPFSQRAPPRV